MGRALIAIFEIAGLVLGVYFIRPDIAYFVKASTGTPAHAAGDAARWPFTQTLERGEHTLLYGTLILLPAMYFLNKILGHKFYSALAVLLFSALCVVFAQVLHASFIDGYVFFISKNRVWASIARPAAIFVVVAGNWLIAFGEMYRVAKVAGK